MAARTSDCFSQYGNSDAYIWAFQKNQLEKDKSILLKSFIRLSKSLDELQVKMQGDFKQRNINHRLQQFVGWKAARSPAGNTACGIMRQLNALLVFIYDYRRELNELNELKPFLSELVGLMNHCNTVFASIIRDVIQHGLVDPKGNASKMDFLFGLTDDNFPNQSLYKALKKGREDPEREDPERDDPESDHNLAKAFVDFYAYPNSTGQVMKGDMMSLFFSDK